jgi:hypothetical protein
LYASSGGVARGKRGGKTHVRLNRGRNFDTALRKKHKTNSAFNSTADAHLNAAGYELDAASKGAKYDAAVVRFGTPKTQMQVVEKPDRGLRFCFFRN